jgi:hypothetical protein
MSSEASNKVVVFDLDETLGYFLELGVIWEALLLQVKPQELLTQEIFNKVLDLYPEFIRPNLFAILKYLKRLKRLGLCRGVMIYTNNKRPPEWAHLIKNYIHEKIEYMLFDQIIGAFKVNGETIEICRTTNDKNKNDLIRCTKLPSNVEICFIDDVYHPNMMTDNIYYIKLNSYVYALPPNVVIKRLVSSSLARALLPQKTRFIEFATNYMKRYISLYVTKTDADYEIDKIVSKQLMILLQEFFK